MCPSRPPPCNQSGLSLAPGSAGERCTRARRWIRSVRPFLQLIFRFSIADYPLSQLGARIARHRSSVSSLVHRPRLLQPQGNNLQLLPPGGVFLLKPSSCKERASRRATSWREPTPRWRSEVNTCRRYKTASARLSTTPPSLRKKRRRRRSKKRRRSRLRPDSRHSGTRCRRVSLQPHLCLHAAVRLGRKQRPRFRRRPLGKDGVDQVLQDRICKMLQGT